MGHIAKSFSSISGKVSTKMHPSSVGVAAVHTSRELVRGFYLRDNLCDFHSVKQGLLVTNIYFLLSLPTSALHTKMLILGWGRRLFGARRWPLAGPLTWPGLSLPSAPAICGRERGRTSCHRGWEAPAAMVSAQSMPSFLLLLTRCFQPWHYTGHLHFTSWTFWRHTLDCASTTAQEMPSLSPHLSYLSSLGIAS